jgi:hypothetical protein
LFCFCIACNGRKLGLSIMDQASVKQLAIARSLDSRANKHSRARLENCKGFFTEEFANAAGAGGTGTQLRSIPGGGVRPRRSTPRIPSEERSRRRAEVAVAAASRPSAPVCARVRACVWLCGGGGGPRRV